MANARKRGPADHGVELTDDAFIARNRSTGNGLEIWLRHVLPEHAGFVTTRLLGSTNLLDRHPS